MSLSNNKVIIISGTMIGSIFLFSTSLYCVNYILLISNDIYNKSNKNNYDNSHINKLLIINGVTMMFSGALFGYFTYNAIK